MLTERVRCGTAWTLVSLAECYYYYCPMWAQGCENKPSLRPCWILPRDGHYWLFPFAESQYTVSG